MVATDTIVAFLREEIEPAVFASMIDAEVRDHFAALTKKGASAPIYVVEGSQHTIHASGIYVLKRALDSGSLSQEAASYVADAMIMSDSLDVPDDDAALDILYDIANPPV